MNNLIVALSGLLLCAAAQAQLSAYLPATGQLAFTPSYVYSTYDEFWMGNVKTDLGTRQSQHNGFVTFEYGAFDHVAFDLTLGYTYAEFEDGPDDDGLMDTTFGMRWQLIDEKNASCPCTPTTSIRFGGIIEGTYDDSFPFSAGDGASGFEASLLFAKEICSGFGLYGDIGWRTRNHSVPDDLFGSAGAYATFKGFSLSGGYRHIQGLSGGDIGDTTGRHVFDPAGGPGTYGFPQVKEINQLVEASLGYTDGGGRYYSVFGARNVDGKNTGDKWIAGASITVPFQVR
jgi:hypothetical protein